VPGLLGLGMGTSVHIAEQHCGDIQCVSVFLSDFHLRTEQLNEVFILPKVGSTFATREKSSVTPWAHSACTINDDIGRIFGNKVSEKHNSPFFPHIDVHGTVTVKKYLSIWI